MSDIPQSLLEGLIIPLMEGSHDAIPSRMVDARIEDGNGVTLFFQPDVEVPEDWSDRAATICADKYFRGHMEDPIRGICSPNREISVYGVVGRITGKIRKWGEENNYYRSEEDADNHQRNLTMILLKQLACFNSPVWFNLGVEGEIQQCSACFILETKDTMTSIIDRVRDEAVLFKGGSGSGANNSRLRGSMEKLSKSGYASGPVPFMRLWDTSAGVIKSGGKNRRAAKLEILDCDHPDIFEFIRCKAEQDKKHSILKDAGFGVGSINENNEVFHQNSNHSVRCSDSFIKAVFDDLDWHLIGRAKPKDDDATAIRMIDKQPGPIIETVRARDILKAMAECAWSCGDPGILYNDAMNEMNTVPDHGEIEACNPCVEFLFLNNNACNLASINLIKLFNFDYNNGSVDEKLFRSIIHNLIIAMDIIAGSADYPTELTGENSRKYRPLGLGYSNLGAVLMSYGIPYDSDLGRSLASNITSYMTATSYEMSGNIQLALGDSVVSPYAKGVMDVVIQHVDSAIELNKSLKDIPDIEQNDVLFLDDLTMWEVAKDVGSNGYRNCQVTVIAPTGTISFVMDCDTTGIEPLISLNTVKRMSGGGELILDLPECAKRYIKEFRPGTRLHDVVSGNPDRPIGHGGVLDCAIANGTAAAISPEGHIKMLASVIPFVSGSISKTVNCPNETTVEDIFDMYLTSWKLGLKNVAIYRDGSKAEQVYQTSEGSSEVEKPKERVDLRGTKRGLPANRDGSIHKFKIGGHKGYLIVGTYSDGTPAEIFVKMAKEGSTIAGLMDGLATLVSMGLQYGVPLSDMVRKFEYTRFEPHGITSNPEIRIANSPIDYIFRYLGLKYLPDESNLTQTSITSDLPLPSIVSSVSGPPCNRCGTIMQRQGSCHVCPNCGMQDGCS